MSKTIALLGLGGTIAGQAASASDNVGYVAGQVGAHQLLGSAMSLAGELDDVQFRAEQLAQVDSKDMSFGLWREVAVRVCELILDNGIDAIVITHGTDTLEETAYFLDRMLSGAKPVVITCAMRPATSRQADGPQNLRDAIAVACDQSAYGVLVVCAGKVHAPRYLQKVHPYRLDPFESVDAGPLAYVEEGRVRWVNGSSANLLKGRAATRFEVAALPLSDESWPRIEVLTSHAGATGWAVDALIAQNALRSTGVPLVQGIVVAGTGNGTLHEAMTQALLRAQAAGILVVRASRCLEGCVLPTAADPFEHSQGLPPVKARIELMLSLVQKLSSPMPQMPVR